MRNKNLNFSWQDYKGIKIRVIDRLYGGTKAKRFLIKPASESDKDNQNVWIPNKHLSEDATIKEKEDIDYIFRLAQRKLELAGYVGPIPGIKRTSS